MAERDETLAEIVAEMRNWSKPHHHPDRSMVAMWADRVEAAWKCDRDELVAKAESEKRWADHYFQEWQKGGNAAKLREAAGNALCCLNWMAESTEDEATKAHLAKPIGILSAALDAPPRNCDRFATAAEAVAAHKQAEENCPPADCPECPYVAGRKSGVHCFEAWLFAPAAQEGGK